MMGFDVKGWTGIGLDWIGIGWGRCSDMCRWNQVRRERYIKKTEACFELRKIKLFVIYD